MELNPKISIPLTVGQRIQPVPLSAEPIQQTVPLSVQSGGGTRDYNNLANKPKLNDVTIEGEHEGEYYGFGNVSYLEYEEVASGGQQGQDDNPFSGGETVEYGSDAPSSGDYADLQNKPRINGVILTGNLTTADLGIDYSQISGKPTINQAPLQSGDNSLASLGINRASNADVNRLFL